jgi:gluconate 2-dehydrogenase gamma chain
MQIRAAREGDMVRGLSRRHLLAAGVAGAVPVATSAATFQGEMPWKGGAQAPQSRPAGDNRYIFFTDAEAAFVEAASDRMIPDDELGAGAVKAGVPEFIDRQLAGEFGQGARWYLQGPWPKGQDTQGYQSRLTPAALYRASIRAIDDGVGRHFRGKNFSHLAASDQDAVLAKLESGEFKLGQIDSKTFFDMFLQNVIEGFWSDPIYGGNREMVGWKLIGFPGARYDQRPFVSKHGQRYPLPPVGLKGRKAWNGS